MPVSQVTFLCLSAPSILGGLFGFREIDTQFVRESTHVKRYQVKWNLEMESFLESIFPPD